MTSCGIWYSVDGYYNILTNGEVQKLSNGADASPGTSQQPIYLLFENNTTPHSLTRCAFDGTNMYAIADANQALYRIQKQGNFTASQYSKDAGFSKNMILPLTNWKDHSNCVYLVNSTGLRPECGNNTNTLTVINDSAIDYANFGAAVTASPNIIYRLDNGSQLSTITINNTASSTVRRPLFPPLNINSMANVTVSINAESTSFLIYEKSSGLVQIIKSINTNIDSSQTLSTDNKQISDKDAVGATFHNSDLIIAMTGNQYNQISTSGLFPTDTTSSVPTSYTASGSSERYIDPAVAGGFTVLGLVLGALLVIAAFFLRRWVKRRNKPTLDPNEYILTPGTKEILSDKIHVEEAVYPPYEPLPRNAVEVTILNGPSLEANPMQTSIPSIFLGRCNIQGFETAQHSSNPHIAGGIYLRECTYNGKPGLIHYMASDNADQFQNFVQSLNAIQALPYKHTNMLELYGAYEFTSPTEDDYRIQYAVVTSYYEVKESLAHLYKRYKDGTTVVNVKDEIFVICTIHSILKSVRDVHKAGYTHGHLSIYSFYAESCAPTLDWILSDFNNATPNSKMTANPRSDVQKDIYDLGCIIYSLISGGRSFSDDKNRGLIENIILEVTQNQRYQSQYKKILESSLKRDKKQRYNADHLVNLWESFFDFNN